MRISELSQTSGVPTATIKYYLREGLLHEGELTSATQAQYDDSHLSRLALIRALVGAGGLSLATTRRVLDQLDRTDLGIHQLLGVTQDAILADQEPVDTTDAAELVADLGWTSYPQAPPLRRLAKALAALEASGLEVPRATILAHAQAMADVAERDVADIPTVSRPAAVRHVILGSILLEPILLALRQLAHIDASARRFTEE